MLNDVLEVRKMIKYTEINGLTAGFPRSSTFPTKSPRLVLAGPGILFYFILFYMCSKSATLFMCDKLHPLAISFSIYFTFKLLFPNDLNSKIRQRHNDNNVITVIKYEYIKLLKKM